MSDDAAAIERRMREAAERYAAADKSDPFCMARILLHMRMVRARWTDDNGKKHDARTSISSLTNDRGEPAYYSAKQIAPGVYIDMVRP